MMIVLGEKPKPTRVGEKPTRVAIRAVGGDRVDVETAYGCLIPMLKATANARVDFRGVGANWSHMAHNQSFWELTHAPIERQPDYVLLIDSDMMFPPDSLDRLLAHKVDIVGATYRRRRFPFGLLEYPLVAGPSILVSGERGIKEWSAMPAGLLLVSMAVIRAGEYPWFYDEPGKNPDDFRTGDLTFARDARSKGFRVFCDCGLSRQVAHVGTLPIPFDLPK